MGKGGGERGVSSWGNCEGERLKGRFVNAMLSLCTGSNEPLKSNKAYTMEKRKREDCDRKSDRDKE